MLEKPDLSDEALIACVRREYGLPIDQVTFLPLGADLHTAVYRAVAADATPYFLKLRSGKFAEVTVALPSFLKTQGVAPVVAPLATADGRLWTRLGDFAVIIYPFIEGRDGFQAALSERQWVALGAALKGIHTAAVPAALRRRIPTESYDPRWRDMVRASQAQAERDAFDEPAAAGLAAFMRAQRDEIATLVERAEDLAAALRAAPPVGVVCHADIHAGNVLVGPGDALAIVDWDTPIVAPKERDLMFVGAGIGDIWREPWEADAFYRGYGPVAVDPVALAYYRHERIVEDIAVTCQQLFTTTDGGANRAEGLRFLVGSFQPGSVVEIARASDVPRPG